MPLHYQHNINDFTRLAVWKIDEPEAFFTRKVSVQQSVSHPHKRLQHLAGRFLLPYLFPDFPSELIQIADTRKPFLPDETYHFSISHCGDYAAAIVSSQLRVGIDVEMVTHRVDKIRHKFLHPTELKEWNIEGLEPTERYNTLTLLWSAKEAMFKWYGHGEVDFKQHLRIYELNFDKPDSGHINAAFMKFDEQPLQLPFTCWPNLVLSWLAV